jgi:hypothetical protein
LACQPGQRPRGTGPSYATGPVGEGAAAVGISTIEAANAFLPAFLKTHNARFAKPPASEQDLHRPIAGTNDLDDILCWREQRSVSRQLVVNYNRMKFMLRSDKTSAALAGKVVDIYDFPDGRLEIR